MLWPNLTWCDSCFSLATILMFWCNNWCNDVLIFNISSCCWRRLSPCINMLFNMVLMSYPMCWFFGGLDTFNVFFIHLQQTRIPKYKMKSTQHTNHVQRNKCIKTYENLQRKTHYVLESQITKNDLRLQNLGWLYLKQEISRSMFNSKVTYYNLVMVTRMWTHSESKTLDN